MDYYSAQEGAVAIEDVVVCGPGTRIPGLVERLQRSLGHAFSVATPSRSHTSMMTPRSARPSPSAWPWRSSDAPRKPHSAGGSPWHPRPASQRPAFVRRRRRAGGRPPGRDAHGHHVQRHRRARKTEVDQLEADLEAATAEADRLAAFTRFATLRTQRESTLASLAQSRFDWERVMRELALIIPEDVTLTNLNGSASRTPKAARRQRRSAPRTSRSRAAPASHAAVARVPCRPGGHRRRHPRRARPHRGRSATGATGASVGDSTLCGDANTFDLSVAFDNASVSAEAAQAASVNPPRDRAPVSEAPMPEDPSADREGVSRPSRPRRRRNAAGIVPGRSTP